MAAGPPVPAAAAAPAAAPALATPSIQKTAPGWENTMAVKDGKVSKLRPCCCSCSCYSFYSKDSSRMGKHHGSEAAAAAQKLPNVCYSFYSKDSSRMGKHQGSEGRKSLPNVTSETHR